VLAFVSMGYCSGFMMFASSPVAEGGLDLSVSSFITDLMEARDPWYPPRRLLNHRRIRQHQSPAYPCRQVWVLRFPPANRCGTPSAVRCHCTHSAGRKGRRRYRALHQGPARACFSTVRDCRGILYVSQGLNTLTPAFWTSRLQIVRLQDTSAA
jgi:hypothetical protein